MKRIILVLISSLTLMVASGATVSALPKLCSMPPAYRAVYEYPTGTYWVKQITKFPAYYAANNTYYQTKYGC